MGNRARAAFLLGLGGFFLVTTATTTTRAAIALFGDNFDDGLGATRWATVSKNAADTGSNFAFDYTNVLSPINGQPIGVPQAGQSTHTGLQLWANRTAGVVNGINAYANGLNLTGSAVMQFDMYARFADAGGSTIYGLYGYYHSTQDGTWNSISPNATSGYWHTTASDNGTTSQYRSLEAGSNLGTAANYLGGSQNGAATPQYQALFPDLDGAAGNSVAGTILNRWVNVRMTRDMGTGEIKLEMKNPADASYTQIFDFFDTTQTQNSGTITLGMTDPFASISGPETYFLFDNVQVTELPEPASLTLVGLGAITASFRRRQHRAAR